MNFKFIPPPPTPPLNKILREGSQPWCVKCHSSRANGGFLNLFKKNGCINPECENYYKE